MLEVIPFLLSHAKDLVSIDGLIMFVVIYAMVRTNHKIELSATQRQSQFEKINDRLDSHIKEEEKEFKHIDARFNMFQEGLKILQETMTTISKAMDTYAITNHDILDNELSQIDSVIYMSATSVANILKNVLLDIRKGVTNINVNDLMLEVAADVEKDRRKYHAELVTKGVSTRTVEIWEETEKESFESFMFRITQTFNKLVELKGNGTVDKLIERECELLRDYLHSDFMKRFKRRIAVIK